ncbi:hypothetical protein [Mycolicibacterium hippocampi]|uniref:Uncharacterized protein n=1 Tax=Mycolicibacterium hippocampi TaxID=659824 RepID=A0A850PUZ4_9MYCO|nr:hypothetical protein [Mycolicibacterium hippocampi]NVN52273.1 hypothetical protein [Mycolicibacterium hippocampi]
MSDNAFDPQALEMPKPADLRRAIECMLLHRNKDASGIAMVLDEADGEHRMSFVIAALLFLGNQFADQAAAEHNFDVEANLRHLQAALAAQEEDEGGPTT